MSCKLSGGRQAAHIRDNIIIAMSVPLYRRVRPLYDEGCKPELHFILEWGEGLGDTINRTDLE
jgi:hypothetical protein